MAATGTVRISDSSRRALRELSEREQQPMQTVLDRAIEDYRRRHFLEALNESFANLTEENWQAEQEERDEWDSTIGDATD